jgi:predicted phosphodiesterase
VRVAALYDVHGNLPALDAVLAEVEREAPDAIVVGGDVVTGPLPAETLDRLLAARPAPSFLRGNTDRELVELDDGTSTLRDEGADAADWLAVQEWVLRRLGRAARDLLASFGETLVLDVDGLGPTRFCHGSPRSDEEDITRVTAPERLARILAGTTERVVVCGHTHVQFDRDHHGTRVVNAGSVGWPSEGRPGAYWLLLGPGVEPRRTPYDLDAAAARFRAGGYPDVEALRRRLTADDPALADAESVRRERRALAG